MTAWDPVRALVEERRRAQERLADLVGDYAGIVEACGQPVAPARLEARPVARTCITCASRRS